MDRFKKTKLAWIFNEKTAKIWVRPFRSKHCEKAERLSEAFLECGRVNASGGKNSHWLMGENTIYLHLQCINAQITAIITTSESYHVRGSVFNHNIVTPAKRPVVIATNSLLAS